MARPTLKKQRSVAEDSEFTFHLIGKKTAMGTSGAIVGAIVAGPVGALVGGALGTALGAAADASPKKIPSGAKAPKSATLQAKATKPKSKRRRRPARIAPKT